MIAITSGTASRLARRWSTPLQAARLIVMAVAALVLLGLAAEPVRANGVPVQVFLEHLPFKATWTPADGARGVAVVASNDELVRVMAQHLPEPPEGTVYYAWLEQVEGGFLPVGSLRYADGGTATIDQQMKDLPYSETFSWVLVTLEEEGTEQKSPSENIALAGRLPNALAIPRAGGALPELLPVTGASAAELAGESAASTTIESVNKVADNRESSRSDLSPAQILWLMLTGFSISLAITSAVDQRRSSVRNDKEEKDR